MTFLEVLLNVLSIIGIVLIGGVIIYLLGGILIKLLSTKDAKEQNEQKTQGEVKPFVQEQNFQQNFQQDFQQQQDLQIDEPRGTISNEKFVLDNEKVEDVDYDKAAEEKKALGAENEVVATEETAKIEESTQKSDDVNDIFNDDKDFNFDDFDFDAFFDEQNKNEETKQEEVKVETELLGEPVTDLEPIENQIDMFENNTQNVSVVENNNNTSSVVSESFATATQTSTNTTTNTETTNTVYVENHELEELLRKEIDGLKEELENQKALYEELKTQSKITEEKWQIEKDELQKLYADAEKREQENNEKSLNVLSIEEYQARLELLRERLKENERDLKQNRKEFIPLRRVRKNLDKDKSKLRRREAIVAKQKVMLYGVNNIMEIDQEKAKKLAEDLDLLEGLKVSVRHCEEVMEANKDRYPVLETANRILTTTNEELKADIHACELAILKIRRDNGEDVDESIFEETVINENGEEVAKRKRGRPRKSEQSEKTEKTTKTEKTAKAEKTEIIDLAKLKRDLSEKDETILHIAETENAVVPTELGEVIVAEDVPTTTGADTETKTTVTVKTSEVTATTTTVNNETQTKTQTKNKVHEFNFDADEPSFDDLFAIENEEMFGFEDDDDNKKGSKK